MKAKFLGKWPITKEHQYLYMNKEYRAKFKEIFNFNFPTMIAFFEEGECSVYLKTDERETLRENLLESLSEENLNRLDELLNELIEKNDIFSLTAFENWANEIGFLLENKLFDKIGDKIIQSTRFDDKRYPLEDKNLDLMAKYISLAAKFKEITKDFLIDYSKKHREDIRKKISGLLGADRWISDGRGLKEFKGDLKLEEVKLSKELKGIPGNKGVVKGKARVAKSFEEASHIKEGEILVAFMTCIQYEVYMNKAAGFITEIGGVTSHAAIISREQNKPCLLSVKGATSKIKTGDFIELNANEGYVKLR